MWSDLAPAAAGARSDRKLIHITVQTPFVCCLFLLTKCNMGIYQCIDAFALLHLRSLLGR